MVTLITDRSAADVAWLEGILAKDMRVWTAAESMYFWFGEGSYGGILTAEGDELWTATDAVQAYDGNGLVRGAYNATDLNRVTAAMDDLHARLTAYGYATGYRPLKIDHRQLPEEYTKLEYIESTGTQYIDTGFKPTYQTRVVIDVQLAEYASVTRGIFGSRNANSPTASQSFSMFQTSATEIRTDYFGTGKTISVDSSSARLLIDKSANATIVGGATVENTAVSSGESPYNLYLLSYNNIGSPPSSGSTAAKLYSCQIYDNGTLIRDYIPCLNPSGKVGLFDWENGVFYANAGTGSFVAGPEIVDDRNPFLWYEGDIPTREQFGAYLANLRALRGVLDLPAGTPRVPADAEELTYGEANDIEHMLNKMDFQVVTMATTFVPAGEAVSGGDYL